MFRLSYILRRLTPPRRFVAWLAVLALLVHAAVLGLHQPMGPLLAMAADGGVHCTDHRNATADPDGSEPAAPGHAGARCPFCTLVQGGKLLPPSPVLVFPPAGNPVAILLPASATASPAIRVAEHRPRGPPAES